MVQKSWFEHMLMIVKTLHNAYMQKMNKIEQNWILKWMEFEDFVELRKLEDKYW